MPSKYIDDYNDWRNMIWSIRAMGSDFMNIAVEISKRYNKFCLVGFLSVWKNYADNHNNKITSKSFFHFCKEGDSVKFKELCSKWSMDESTKGENGDINFLPLSFTKPNSNISLCSLVKTEPSSMFERYFK